MGPVLPSSPAQHGAPIDSSSVCWLRALRVAVAGGSLILRTAARSLTQFGATVTALTDDDRWLSCDVVLVDRVGTPALPGLEDDRAESYLRYVTERNRGVWVTASCYGLDSHRADARGSDLSVLASGGVLGHSRIGDDQAPTVPAGAIGLKLVGSMLSLAALHGISMRRAGAGPVHIDLAAQAAVIATGLSLEMAHALLNCPDEGGSARYGAPTGFFACRDGAVYVVVLEQHQWNGLLRCVPALAGVQTVEEGRASPELVNAAVAQWAAARPAEECERMLQEAGVACTAVNELSQFVSRSAGAGRPFQLTDLNDGAMMPAVITQPRPRAASPGRAPRALEQLRVLDAGHVLAVPLATAWLGAMGASVSKLEDPDRLDVYRRRGPFADGVPGLNRSAYFNAINYCKDGLEVAPGPDGPRPVDISAFDVIVQNLSPRRAAALGVDEATLLATPGSRLGLISSGFGAQGAWSGYRAYGHNIHAFAGLVSATRDARGEMADVGTPWCDPLTSVAQALYVCAWALGQTESPTTLVDISMSETLANQLGELLDVDPSETYEPRSDERDAFIRVGSTALLAVSLRGRGEIEDFQRLIGQPLSPARFRGELLDITVPVAPGETAADVEQRMIAAGFAAALVRTAPELSDDPFLRATGLFQTVSSAALDAYDVVGLPWRLVGEPYAPLTAAPERPEP